MQTRNENGQLTKIKTMTMQTEEINARVNTGTPTGPSEHPGGRNVLDGGTQGLHKNKTSEPSAGDFGPSLVTENTQQTTLGGGETLLISQEGGPSKSQSPSHRNGNKVDNNDNRNDHHGKRQDLPPKDGTAEVDNMEVGNMNADHNDKGTDPREKRQDLSPLGGALTKRKKLDDPQIFAEETGFPPCIFGSQLITPSLSTITKARKSSLVSATYESDTDEKANISQGPETGTKREEKEQRKEQPVKHQAPKKAKKNKRQHWTKFEAFNSMFGGEQDWQIYLILTLSCPLYRIRYIQ